MAYMAWDSPEIIAYSKDKEQTAYQFGYIIGSTLLAIMMAFVTKNAADILADKQLMGNLMGNAKLQFRGILSQRDCIALAVGNKGATTIQIGQVYTPAAVAVIEGSVSTAAEQGIILKAGKVLSAGYPAGKIGADTAEKICDEVKDGETDAEEIADEVDKWDNSNRIFRESTQLDVDLISNIKQKYNAGKTRNAACAKGIIDLDNIDLECISGKCKPGEYYNKGNFEPPLPENYYYQGPIPEYVNHTEQKIVEFLRNKYKENPNISGEIEIISERAFCDNCSVIVDMFEKEFPNIKVIRVEIN